MSDEDELIMYEETIKAVPKIKRERTDAQKANDQKNRELLLARHQAIRDEKRKKDEEKAEKERLKQQKKEEALIAKQSKSKKPTIKVVKKVKPVEPESDDDEELELAEEPVKKPAPKAKATQKPRVKKVVRPPSPVSVYDDDDDVEEEEEEEPYVPPPKKPARQVSQPVPQQYYTPVPQQYYAPVPQRVRPIITYV